MMQHQGSVSPMPACAGGLAAPMWSVTIRSRISSFDARPTNPVTVATEAAARGVELEIDSLHCVARFLAGGDDLRAATGSALDRWDLVHRDLCLPDWTVTAMIVTQLTFESPDRGPRVKNRVRSHPTATGSWGGALNTPEPRIPRARDAFGDVRGRCRPQSFGA